MLSAWRSCFAFHPGTKWPKWRSRVGVQLAAWIEKHITDNAARNPLSYTLSPERAWATHRADARNRGLLFVAVCRAQGIPARIDEVTGQVQFVATNGTMPTEQTAQWQTVKFGVEAEQTPQCAQATLKLFVQTAPLHGKSHLLYALHAQPHGRGYAFAAQLSRGPYVAVGLCTGHTGGTG